MPPTASPMLWLTVTWSSRSVPRFSTAPPRSAAVGAAEYAPVTVRFFTVTLPEAIVSAGSDGGPVGDVRASITAADTPFSTRFFAIVNFPTQVPVIARTEPGFAASIAACRLAP